MNNLESHQDSSGMDEVKIGRVASRNRVGEEGGSAEIHAILVTSTAHVTRAEAQSLTSLGYCRGESGWLFYVSQDGFAVLPGLADLSDGLRGVIQQAHVHGCNYV